MKPYHLLPLALVPALALGADAAPVVDPSTEVPFADVWLSVTALSAAVLPITGWLRVHLLKNVEPQAMSWGVAVALAFAGYALKLGMFAETGPVWTAIYGLAAGLTANGMADHGLVKFVLRLLGAKVKKTS